MRQLPKIEELQAGQIVNVVDAGLRHRSGMTPHDYLMAYLPVARQFGFATHDESWGEFEKEFAIIIRRLVVAERALKVHAGEIDVPVMTELLRAALNDKGLTVTMSGDAKPVHNDHSLCELASALITQLGVGE